MNIKTNQLVKNLKENDEDFEWYPTTEEMVKIVYDDLRIRLDEYGSMKAFSMLDIGAGNGSVFSMMDKMFPTKEKNNDNWCGFTEKYAIEKSQILVESMIYNNPEIKIIGTDFYRQSLIDKKVDVIFCNPIYSDFVTWMEKIIKESNSDFIYFVVPERWRRNQTIITALNSRLKSDYHYIKNNFIFNDEKSLMEYINYEDPEEIIVDKIVERDRINFRLKQETDNTTLIDNLKKDLNIVLKEIETLGKQTGFDLEKIEEDYYKKLKYVSKKEMFYKPRIKILSSTDFLDSEFRKARAKVDIVCIDLSSHRQRSPGPISDPFEIFFNESFEIKADKVKYENLESSRKADKSSKEFKEEINNKLVAGTNLIEILEGFYQEDMHKLLNTYKALENLDYELLTELEVKVDSVKENLRLKIEGLKNKYWQELFDNMSTITEKLTSGSRKTLLNKLLKSTTIDFTAQNAYTIVLWAIKNANTYLDDQLKNMYLDFVNEGNISEYKSNARFQNDNWKYLYDKAVKNSWNPKHGLQKLTNWKLKMDYRLVLSGHNVFSKSYMEWREKEKGLYNSGHEFIGDICTIAQNLGFNVLTTSYDHEWEPGKSYLFYFKDSKTGKKEVLMKIRAFMNGNVHMTPHKEFIKKLNIEAGRLLGWFANKEDASEKLDLTLEEVAECFKSNYQMLPSNVKLISSQTSED